MRDVGLSRGWHNKRSIQIRWGVSVPLDRQLRETCGCNGVTIDTVLKVPMYSIDGLIIPGSSDPHTVLFDIMITDLTNVRHTYKTGREASKG